MKQLHCKHLVCHLQIFFENRNNYISVLFQVDISSDVTISKRCFLADVLQFDEEETMLSLYVGCVNNLLGLIFALVINKNKETNTFNRAEIVINPIE